jgi:amino acid adenylation domain-containing protein
MKNKNVESFYPLSPMQQGMLFHTLYAPESGVYMDQTRCLLQGDLNVAALEGAWQQAMDRHPSLRTAFLWDGLKEPVQVVHAQVRLPIEQHDWRGLSTDETDERLKAYVLEHKRRGMELTKPPLMRLALMRTGEETYWFVWTRSHLLLDGWSGAILLREVFAFYEANSRGQELSLERSRPYRDYILWLKQQDMAQAENFWRQTLKGFTAPTPLNITAPANVEVPSAEDYTNCELRLSTAVTSALSAIAREHQLTFNTIVQGAWALLLSHYSGEHDVVFGATVSGRPSELAGIESMVGLFINTLPVRVQVNPGATIVEWLKDLQFQQSEARQYEYSPLVQIQGWSDVPRGSSLFETVLVFENYPLEEAAQGQDMTLKVSDFHTFELTNYPLNLGIVGGTELMFSMLYDRRLFEETTVKRILGHLEALLEGFARDEKQRLDALSPLTDAERRQVLIEWNQTDAAFPDHQCVHELFEEQAARTPGAIAVVFEDEQLSYGELDARANQLARHLRSLGVATDSLVGVLMERSVEMVVALLAVLKAGAAYVPLDPEYPSERLAFMLADADVEVLLIQQRLRHTLSESDSRVRVICSDDDWQAIAQQSTAPLPRFATPSNLVYMLYTSGSTGRPKGAMITHGAVVNYIRWMQSDFPLNASDSILQKTPFGFDVSVWEFFAPLAVGARLIMARPGDHRDPSYLVQVSKEESVSTLQLVPSQLRVLLDEPGFSRLDSLRHVFCGGEVMTTELEHRFLTSMSASLTNICGPTETTIDTVFWTCKGDGRPSGVPLGRPVANTQLYVLDAAMRPVPIGVMGELYVGGVGVGRGYWKRPDMTAEKFVPHPYSRVGGERLYRSGDVARFGAEGEVEFLGRIDYQVKIRGFRVELGEVQAALSACEGVRDCVVVVHRDANAEERLVAYVVAEDESPTTEELRAVLQQTLPEFMVPSIFVTMEEIPLLTNGKVDRQSLPAPGESRAGAEKVYVAPRNRTEELLAGIWSEVLGIEKVGIDSNFFDLGGHSLLAIRIVTRVREVFNVKLPLSELFVSPHVARLAELIDNLQAQPKTIDVQPAPKIGRRNRNPEQQFAELDKLSETEAQERVLAKLQTN